MSTLFREDVMRLGAATQFGDAVFHQPPSLKVVVMSMITVFIALLLFVAVARIKTTVPVPGHLSPVSGEVQVYAERTGIVRELLAFDGDEVSQGQPLAILETPFFDRSGDPASQPQLRRLAEQIEDLLARREALGQRLRLDEETEHRRAAAQQLELELLGAQQRTLDDRLALVQRSFEREQSLHQRGLLADAELEQKRDALLTAVQATQAQQLRIATQQGELDSTQRRLQRLPLQGTEELLLLSTSLSQLKSHQAELQQQSVFSVAAPAAGVVSNQILVVGEQVDARVPFLSLVAADARLEVHLYVPSRALGELAPGQEVMVELDAYPARLHGTWSAEVSSISGVAMNPREFVFPLDLKEPVYLVRARLRDVVGSVTLRSGMQLGAQIVTGDETILQRITAPLRNVGRRF